jgi:hypothetical protein
MTIIMLDPLDWEKKFFFWNALLGKSIYNDRLTQQGVAKSIFSPNPKDPT